MAKVEDDLPGLGVSLHRLNDEQRAAWTTQAQSSYDAILESIGGDAEEIYNLVLEGQVAYARLKDEDS
jgi:hypothetical protein